MSQRQYSDPFLDPISLTSNPVDNAPQLSPARERELEIQGWVDDWQAAEAMLTGQIPPSRRSGSPDKSDRTSSTLSEQSARSVVSTNSIQRSIVNVSRSLSQYSQRTTDLLFNTTNAHNNPPSDPQPSNTDTTRNHSPDYQDPSSMALNPYRRSQSLTLVSHPRALTDQFTTAPPTFPILRAESEALLGDGPNWATPPESPIKGPHITKATGFLGSVRRALTSTLATATRARSNSASPEREDPRSSNSSPTKRHYPADSLYTGQTSDLPRRAASAGAAIWRRKQGPTDWDAERQEGESPTKGKGKGKETSTTLFSADQMDGDADGEWDVEAAVQNRLVQVMFTVPKERLRVVNANPDADGLSVSDAGGVVDSASVKDKSGTNGGREEDKDEGDTRMGEGKVKQVQR